jgi:predicted outer membrane repeat protein
MDIASGSSSAAARRLALVLVLVLVLLGCGEEKPVDPEVPLGKGYIAGTAFVHGAPERTSGILIKILPPDSDDAISTTFPNDQGAFLSDALDAGTYDVEASVDDEGYTEVRRRNIVVVAENTTQIPTAIIVQDTTTIRFYDLTPPQFTALVGRRPIISGNFSSDGSGFKIETFRLRVNGQLISTDAMQIREDPQQPRRFGSFSYTPPNNLSPGVVTVRASMSNRAGTLTAFEWTFSILDGIARRVPGTYSTIEAAVLDANDGDTILVAPGIYDVFDVVVEKDLHFLAEGDRDVTTLRGRPGSQHFLVENRFRIISVIIEGFTLTGGFPPGQRQGGSIYCRDAHLSLLACRFSDNQCVERGGALAVHESEVVIRDCIFSDNRAYRGGAISIFNQSFLDVEHTLFSRNLATNGFGGAIQVEYATADIRHNTFYRNDVGTGKGSGVIADFGIGRAEVHSLGNLFIENRADGNGGGTIRFNQSEISSICDGFFNNIGGSLTGHGASPVEEELLDLLPGVDPRFCDLIGGDLRLQLDSPFLNGPCERGAYPPGCGR